MSTTTPPRAMAWPRVEWPHPRAAMVNGVEELYEDLTRDMTSSREEGWRTAAGTSRTMLP